MSRSRVSLRNGRLGLIPLCVALITGCSASTSAEGALHFDSADEGLRLVTLVSMDDPRARFVGNVNGTIDARSPIVLESVELLDAQNVEISEVYVVHSEDVPDESLAVGYPLPPSPEDSYAEDILAQWKRYEPMSSAEYEGGHLVVAVGLEQVDKNACATATGIRVRYREGRRAAHEDWNTHYIMTQLDGSDCGLSDSVDDWRRIK